MSRKQAGNIVVCGTEEPLRLERNTVQSRIRERAFEISLERGHAGREIDDWLAAESQVIMSPPFELAEKKGSFIVRLAVAGIDPGDLTIMASRESLLVKADFRHEHESDATIHTCEFKSAMLFRYVPLPSPIDPRSLKTDLSGGILRVVALAGGRGDPGAGGTEAPKKRAMKSAAKSRAGTKS